MENEKQIEELNEPIKEHKINYKEVIEASNENSKNSKYSASLFIVSNEETAKLITEKYNLLAATPEAEIVKTYKKLPITTIILLFNATAEELAKQQQTKNRYIEEVIDFIEYSDYIDLIRSDGEKTNYLKEILINYNNNAKSYQFNLYKKGLTIKELIEAEPEETEKYLQRLAEKAEEEKNKDYTINLDNFSNSIFSGLYEPIETLEEINAITSGGFLRQSLIGIGGTSSAGKTTLALQIAENLAARGKKVLYISLETSADFIIAKLLSRYIYRTRKETLTASEIIKAHTLDSKKRKILNEAIKDFKEIAKNIIVIYPEELTINYIRKVIEKVTYKLEEKPILFIDYIQFITPEGKEDLTATLKKANKYFKNYAVNNNTLAFFLAAFNKEAETKGKESLNNIRDTSDIGYTSDYFISLFYEGEPDTKEPEPIIKASLTKNRLGSKEEIIYKRIGAANSFIKQNTFEQYEAIRKEKEKITPPETEPEEKPKTLTAEELNAYRI